VSPQLGVIVASDTAAQRLVVYRYPPPTWGSVGADCASAPGLCVLTTIQGTDLAPPAQFRMAHWGMSTLVFTTPLAVPAPHGMSPGPLLLVVDQGNDAVHVVDVVTKAHLGYVVPPGTLPSPRSIATRGRLVAVSAWTQYTEGLHAVWLYEGAGSSWTPTRVRCGLLPGPLDGQLKAPCGVRFTQDGTGLVVVDACNGRVSRFHVSDGTFAGHVALGVSGSYDVEECEGGWLIATHASGILHVAVGAGPKPCTTTVVGRVGVDSEECPLLELGTLAVVPGVGVAVWGSHLGGHLHFFATTRDVAMASLSDVRVVWMVAVARSALARYSGPW
jgi:hypothetical protein